MAVASRLLSRPLPDRLAASGWLEARLAGWLAARLAGWRCVGASGWLGRATAAGLDCGLAPSDSEPPQVDLPDLSASAAAGVTGPGVDCPAVGEEAAGK